VISDRDGVLHVSGSMTVTTASRLLEQGRQVLLHGSRRIDLSEVSGADSAGLAVLLAWQRWTQQSGQSLQITGLPEGLRSLAELYDVAEFLPG
jgi:phospholipid transport system transporter-binding protein